MYILKIVYSVLIKGAVPISGEASFYILACYTYVNLVLAEVCSCTIDIRRSCMFCVMFRSMFCSCVLFLHKQERMRLGVYKPLHKLAYIGMYIVYR